MHDGTLSALNLDIQNNPLNADIDFGSYTPTGELFQVPVQFKVPFDELALIPTETAYVGQLKIWFAAKDQNDEISDVQTISVPINIRKEDREKAKGRAFVYPINLTVESGYQDVAMGRARRVRSAPLLHPPRCSGR